jgi:amino acid adenylation domain-containing protein
MAGQPAAAQPGLVGHCVNLLPIRVRVEGGPATDHVTNVMHTLLDAFDHQGLTYGELLPHLTIERDASRLPLVSTILTYETATKGVAFGVEDVYIHGNRRQFCNFDLELYLTEAGGELTLQLNYSADLLAPGTADRWLQMYRVILSAIAEDPTEAVATLPVMDEAERERVLVEWNRTEAPVPDTTLHHWFEAQVAGMPDAVALVCGTERLTYAALNARANRIARRLRDMGVRHGDLVGVCLERTPDLVAAVLGILKTGGAYVPLDPQYPADRVAFIAGDAKLGVIVAQGSVRSVLPPSAAAVLLLDADGAELASEVEENLEPHGAPDDLAYVIYTSGSTGRPKGVAIEHRSAVALLSWAHTVYGPEELAGVLASTSICFDLSVFELFVPLTGGGAVVLVHDALAFPAAPAAEEVTLVNTVPSAMEGLLGSGEGLPPGVQTVNLAGEKLTVELVREIYARTKVRRVYDLYGPSEDTTYSTYALRTADGPYTIGRPIANTRAYVLDGRGQPVPVGAIGELYLGGVGLARGYLNRPRLTAERFVPNPFGPVGSRLYRTGDLARYLPDGSLEFLGRMDHQVKLRGFRIELGEVETVLREHPTVETAVALVREDQPGDRRLVAYVVPAAGAAVSDGEVLEHLHRRVPQYMVPQHLIVLGELPLTPNGKLDRRALPAPDADGADRRDALVEPATPLERDLAAIWRELLRVSRVGRDDDFFAIGGHSLTATRLVARVSERMSVRMPLRIVFEHPTLRGLARWLEAQAAPVGADRDREEVEL